MVTYLTRSAWGARPARGSTALVGSQVKGTAIHWPGSARIDAAGASGQRRVASALRGWQDFHMDGRGWSDIAYQVAVDQAGRAWTLRGLNIRSGANGDGTVNREYGAILLILGPGEEPSDPMKSTVRGVIGDFRRLFPRGTAIRPHSAVRPAGTDCPGDKARAAISRGDFTPGTPPPKDWFDMATKEDLREVVQEVVAAQDRNLYDASKNGTAAKYQLQVMAALAALAKEIDGVDEEVWRTQVANVFTETPEGGEPDTEAVVTGLVWSADRAAEMVLEALEPRLAAIEAAVGVKREEQGQ